MTPTQKDLHRHYKRCIWSLAWEIDNTAHRLRRCRASICATVGLSPERWSALAVIHRSTYVLSISDLARQLRRSRQSAHALAVSMERDRLIRFLPNPDDRRLLQIKITDAGRRFLVDAEQRYNMCLLTMWADLDSDSCASCEKRCESFETASRVHMTYCKMTGCPGCRISSRR